MIRNFSTTTCLAALAASLVTTPVLADTSVTTDTTTPLKTSSAGNVSVSEDGSITLGSGVVVTVDSNNTVTNEGTLEVEGSTGDAGIVVSAGKSTTIDNQGTITVSEDFVPADEDDNNVADGPIASGNNRYGIHVLSGGTVTGSIDNSGTISVEGLNSGGIVLDSKLDGSLTSSGTIKVVGDYSTGIRTGDVTGNVHVSNGSVTVVGEGATALAVNGNVGGAVIIQGAVQQAMSYTNDDGETVTLARSDLRVGAPAVSITGNVANGVIVAIPPSDSVDGVDDDDLDNDGIDDDDEGSGSILSYGNGPALQIGGTSAITIGAAADSGYSLVVDGSVKGYSYYTSTDAYGIVIGGKGGTVDLPGGISVSGSVNATTVDATATAILINQGATVGKLYNSGSITGSISSPGEGAVYGIRDLSGTLTTIENTGYIAVGGTSEDTRHAIDLSANTTGVTISQSINADDAETRADVEEDGDTDSTVYASIQGDIVTGSGNDTLTASDGQIVGNTYFNAGDDQLLLSDRATYSGKVYFGTGAASVAMSGTSSFSGTVDFSGVAGTLTIADSAKFRGTIANGANSSVTVNGGSFGAKAADSYTIGSLTVNSGGTFNAYIDSTTGTSSHLTATTATFASGSKVSATISSIAGVEGTYKILTAGTLTGTATFDASTTDLPWIFAGSVATSGNDLMLTIRRKAATELGLNRTGSQAYEAIVAAAQNDDSMETEILGLEDAATLQTQFNQLLPDNAGGVFDMVTRGSRMAAAHFQDGDSIHEFSNVGGWFEPVFWRGSKDATDTVSYKFSGWGLTGGLERDIGFGRVGLSYAWLKGKVENNGGTGKVDSSQHEFALSWRLSKGPLYAFARVSGARVSLSSARTFTSASDSTSFSYANAADWKGWLYSGAGGVSYEFDVSDNVSLRPQGTIDYYRLHEGGYTESGGGEAMDLTVQSRNSTALNATTSLTASYRFGRRTVDERPLTIEIEGGRRNFLSGSLGTTRAAFEDGDVFSLTADRQKSGWVGEARLLAGGFDFTWKLAARAEEVNGNRSYSGRASLSVAF